MMTGESARKTRCARVCARKKRKTPAWNCARVPTCNPKLQVRKRCQQPHSPAQAAARAHDRWLCPCMQPIQQTGGFCVHHSSIVAVFACCACCSCCWQPQRAAVRASAAHASHLPNVKQAAKAPLEWLQPNAAPAAAILHAASKFLSTPDLMHVCVREREIERERECVCACVRACVRARVRVCVRACVRARARACVHVCVCTRASKPCCVQAQQHPYTQHQAPLNTAAPALLQQPRQSRMRAGMTLAHCSRKRLRRSEVIVLAGKEEGRVEEGFG